jgi:hypothetical protein
LGVFDGKTQRSAPAADEEGMNAPKPSPSTAASAPPSPRPPPPRNAKPTAPFTAFARDRAAPAEPTGDAPAADLSPRGPLAASLDEGSTPPVTSPLARTAQPAPDLGATPDAKSSHVDAARPDTSEPHTRVQVQDDPLDPMLRQPGLFAPPTAPPLPTTPASTPAGALLARASTSLEELLPQLVRKIAWSGDGKRGAVRMELGAGALAGSTLVLESDGGRIRVQLDAPPGVDGEAWKRRIGARLADKRIEVESIEVR